MMMAGYWTVVTTMWAAQDEDAPLIAKQVYANPLRDGVADGGRAANALHSAVKTLRSEAGEEASMRWAPYVHLGL
jgi:ribosome-binding factor A